MKKTPGRQSIANRICESLGLYSFMPLLSCLLLCACNSELSITPEVFNDRKAAVESIDKAAVEPGEWVQVKGKNLTADMAIDINGISVEFAFLSKKELSFIIPEESPEGLVNVSFKMNAKEIAVLPLVVGSATDDIPVVTIAASEICKDIIFKNSAGQLTRGERQCDAAVAVCSEEASAVPSGPSVVPLCATDGETACLASSDFPVVDKQNALIPHLARIASSVSLAGLTGTMPDCSVDGETGCLALGPSFAVALTTGAASKISDGQVLAGVSGTAPVRPADCSMDGGTNCVAVSAFAAAQTSGAAEKIVSGQVLAGFHGTAVLSSRPADCDSDGETDCVAVVDFPAVDKVGKLSAAHTAKIHSSLSIAGVSGTMPDCSSDGASNCRAVSGYPAADTTGAAAKILTGQSLAGVGGSAAVKPANCTTDGGIGCVTVANFPAVDKLNKLSAAHAAKIRSSLTIAGVTGTLNDCSSDGDAGCVVLGPSYAALLKTGAAAKIIAGQSLGGVSGAADGKPADCTSDGGLGCVTTAAFPAVDAVSHLSAPNLAKIHSTVTVGGIVGTMGSCTADGETHCMAAPGFPAANTAGAAAKILDGQTLAGINGSADARPADCAADGSIDCVAVNDFPAIDKIVKLSAANAEKMHSSLTIAGVAGTMDDCALDGGVDCRATASYPAANAIGAAAKILTGQTLAGIPGSGAGRPSDCASDGGTGCVAVADFPAIDKLAKLSAGNRSKIHSSLSIVGLSGTMPSCASDGSLNCMTVAAFPAANATGAAAKIAAGDVLAGVTGTAGVRPSDCSVDGDTGCVATAAYPSANATGAAAKIASGDVLAGITGTAGVRPSDCASDGATGCVAVNDFPAVDKLTKLSAGNAAKIRDTLSIAGVSGTLSDCDSDGDAGCVVLGPTYAAAIITGAAPKILTGESLAGINGSAAVKPADCNSDGGTNCVAVANFPAVNKVTNLAAGNLAKMHSSVTVGGVAGTMPSCSTDGQNSCMAVTGFLAASTTGAAAKILTGQTLAGVSGTALIRPGDCSTDNGTSCVTSAAFPSVVKANVTAGVVKSGTVIAGVTGAYPNATYPLSGADATADLDSPTFHAKIKSSASFEWFDSTGTRYTGTGDSNIIATDIKNGVDIFGTTGNYGADCTADGQTSCLTTSTYKSVNTSALTSWDIRAGKSAGGITGSIAFYKNMAALSSFNRTSGTGALAGVDMYDTLDDGGSTFPTTAPSGWTQATGQSWLRDAASDTNSNGSCDGGEACVYKDRITNLYWSKTDGSGRNWETAITYCNNLSYGTYTSGWRLPTQKELLMAHIDGIWSLKTPLGLTVTDYWSSTSNDATNAWAVMVHAAFLGYQNSKSSQSKDVLCVRE